MATRQSSVSLLQLPDACLVAVLGCCAGDPRSLSSAARAHSRLHQAAVVALSNLTPYVKRNQVDNLVLGYLSHHGQHINSISFSGDVWQLVLLQQLPSALTKLSNLEFDNLKLQLQPGSGYQGVLGAAAVPPLKQLRFNGCRLLDGGEGLAAALSLLPGLEHVSVTATRGNSDMDILQIPLGEGLPGLQQLTYLELAEVSLGPHADDSVGLQLMSPFTGLVDLRLVELDSSYRLTAKMLSGAQHLTRLNLSGGHYDRVSLEPAALAGKTLLQHLAVGHGDLCDNAAGVVQLMSQLQQLQQLTHLSLVDTLYELQAHPEAATYSALTASSKLQHLGVARSCFPAGVWQHVFPAGRQLPHLRVLDLSRVRHPGYVLAAAPEGTRLVSCCPGLQSLSMQGLQYRTEGLASLQGLSSLHSLSLASADGSSEGLEGVCQLTGLRRLSVTEPHSATEGLFLQLAQLRQLTYLAYAAYFGTRFKSWSFRDQARPDDRPVWRQVLRRHVKHSKDPEVVQQAAAALAEPVSEADTDTE